MPRAIDEKTREELNAKPRMAAAPEDESGRFYTCKACGQAVDKRRHAAVFHREEKGHEPIPTNE